MFEESDLIFDSLDLKPRQHSRRYNISKSPSAFDKKSNDSAAVDDADAAIMIQKAYRGHSGRKGYFILFFLNVFLFNFDILHKQSNLY